jgi:hypothetical protein
MIAHTNLGWLTRFPPCGASVNKQCLQGLRITAYEALGTQPNDLHKAY